ncbi:NAD(P)H-binding protein [Oceaniradius stylonematis]|uniref:NAD(P)H-binding protein n=1 Tax=Oceaniradius stylonematis TaxID=2184161 RepID=UPI00247B0DD4|nr:NAD(P)H-binding protein [Oceaniradius stylonematis]
MLGATGTVGRATAHALVDCGHEVVCFVRPRHAGGRSPDAATGMPDAAVVRYGDVTDPDSLASDGFCGARFDVIVSCIASRTGAPGDAWAIDHDANLNALQLAERADVAHFVLLSAICVQKPKLAFQHAKLAFENALIASGLTWSIVRPTAFFKSLSGQVERLRQGKPFLVFGDGRLTACKPISDGDLARYIAGCIDDPERHNRILPIGGPGDAITPRQQGDYLFALLDRPPKFRHVPVALLDAIIWTTSILGRLSSKLAAKAELARIGRYYATESMLVLDPVTGRYDAEATPSFGTETLYGFYDRLVRGEVTADRGDHAVF